MEIDIKPNNSSCCSLLATLTTEIQHVKTYNKMKHILKQSMKLGVMVCYAVTHADQTQHKLFP